MEGMQSLAASTFQDFEVLLYHDGPLSRPLPELPAGLKVKFRETSRRHNDWGHSLRDLGIREAAGEYILHFNPDNLLAPDVLDQVVRINADIVICAIVLEGTKRVGNRMMRTLSGGDRVIMDGFPPVLGNIDAMQLIMRTQLWRSCGGWYDKSEQGDGRMYQEFCKKYMPHYCGYMIGVHR